MTATAASTRPVVGELAPDFTLPSTSGEKVTLSQFRGKQHVLLAFFPMAFTSVCTAELCAFSEDLDQFAGKDVAVFGVSVDAIPSLKAFKAHEKIKEEMLSDFKREVVGPWGLLFADTFFSSRAYVLVDKAGIVRWFHVEPTPGTKRENAEVLAQIALLG
jgi:peroxiredoxin